MISEALRDAVKRGVVFVGHNVLSADKPVLELTLGIKTPPEQWIDSMILHYLCYASLCKQPGKGDPDEGALGFNSLGFASHLWTFLPSYKACRGVGCFGPCPRHQVNQYCAIDAWAGEQICKFAKDFMRERCIPWRVYEEHAYIAFHFCLAAEKRGIDVDVQVVKNLDKRLAEEKERLFPQVGKVHERFNPRSGKQTKEWFGERGLKLDDTERGTIQQTLEKRLFEGYNYNTLEDLEADESAKLTEVDQALFDLFTFKDLGKGSKSWFDPKFFGPDGRIHPRIVYTGTSTLRFSSANPNLQNLTKRSWGKEIRKAIIPPKGMQLVETDIKQLELRMCLHLAGFDLRELKGDPFNYLVDRAGGQFDKAASDAHRTPRDIAKIVSHGANYGMGLELVEPWEIDTEYVRRQIAAGALRVFPDWIYDGKIVALNGKRLAHELFKNWSFESRAKALEVQKIYFDSVPIQNWHRKVFKDIEAGYVNTLWGSYLELLEKNAVDNARVALSKLGQGGGAEVVHGMQINFLQKHMKPDTMMLFQVHDSIIFAVPGDWTPLQIRNFLAPLEEEESHRYPGLKLPWDTKYSKISWGHMEDLT